MMEGDGGITVTENDLSKVEADEKEVVVAKDFEVVPLPAGLVWKAKEALFDTRVGDCEALTKPFAANNLWGAGGLQMPGVVFVMC